MTPQRILHIVGKMDRAGAETMLMNLYRNIDRSQIQFDFVTLTSEAGEYDAEILELDGRIVPIVASHPIKRMLLLKRFLKQHPEYKIVHAHMLLSNAFHLLAARAAGVENRISHAHSTSNGKSNIIKKAYEKWALLTNRKISTHKIACGKLAAQYLFGTTDEVWLLPNAVNIEQMIAVANNSRNYINQELNSNGLKIIQVGRLSEVKNHQFSLNIAEELKNRDIDFTLYIVGQGSLDSNLKQKVKAQSLTNNIKFLGVRSDVTELMASADFMIMPSLYEGFPVVLVESQAAGLKAIVSDQVSIEVDLGLGLIEFLPFDSIDDWVERLINPKIPRPTEKEILDSLKKHSFDAITNAAKLTHFYVNL